MKKERLSLCIMGHNQERDDQRPLDVDKVEKEEVEEVIRKLTTITGTSFAFAGVIMAWLNSYLSKLIPHMDTNQPQYIGRASNNADLVAASNSTSPTPRDKAPDGIPIPYQCLELIFIALSSSGVGILLGVTFIAYHFAQMIRQMKFGEDGEGPVKRFRSLKPWAVTLDILRAVGVFFGFLSVAFSILLFHTSPLYPFLCFVAPLSACALLTALVMVTALRPS